MGARKKVFFCNLAIMFLCVLSILSYFIMPFWKVNAKYTVTADMLEEVIPQSITVGDETFEMDEASSDINFEDIAGEDGLTLKVSIALNTSDILTSFSTTPKKLVKGIVENNVDNLVDQLEEPLDKIVKGTVTAVVKLSFKDGVQEEMKAALGAYATDEQVKQDLKNAGINDKYFEKKANQLVDSIYEDSATAESVANDTILIVEETLQKMKYSGNLNYTDLEFTADAKAELKAKLIERFEAFECDDGTIDPEAFSSEFLADLLKDSRDTAATNLATPLASKKNNKNNSKDELRDALSEVLLDLLNEVKSTIATVIKVLSFVIIFTFIVWLIPIVKILIKWKKPNNAIKMGLPIWLGSIPFIVLCLIPGIAFGFVKSPNGPLSNVIDEIEVLETLSVNFTSCSLISFLVGLALAGLSIFFYGKQRKILKYAGDDAKTETIAPIPTPKMDKLQVTPNVETAAIEPIPTTQTKTEVKVEIEKAPKVKVEKAPKVKIEKEPKVKLEKEPKIKAKKKTIEEDNYDEMDE